jgi:O-antigen ligase
MYAVFRPVFVHGRALRGRLLLIAACCFLFATVIRGGHGEWGWMIVMAIPVLPLGWLALRLLDDDQPG